MILKIIAPIIYLLLFLSCSLDNMSSNNFKNTNPIAAFTFSPDLGNTSTLFVFDASTSSDKEDETSNLKVRWDWGNDGIWDTEYRNSKIDSHRFCTPGISSIKLGVLDSNGGFDSLVLEAMVKPAPILYFPLVIGNSWTYETTYRFGFNTQETGIEAWEIMAINDYNNSFTIKCIFNGVSGKFDAGVLYDSTLIIDRVNIFDIQLVDGSNYETMSMVLKNITYSQNGTVVLNNLLNRQIIKENYFLKVAFPPSSNNLLEVNSSRPQKNCDDDPWQSINYKIQRELGILELNTSSYHSCLDYGSSITIKLISHQIFEQ